MMGFLETLQRSDTQLLVYFDVDDNTEKQISETLNSEIFLELEPQSWSQ